VTEGFQHAIAGGQGKLIVSQLQSPNFDLGTLTGWAILKNGNAYFFNITATGDITATQVIAGTAPNPQIELTENSGIGQLLFVLNSASFKSALVESAIVGSFADLVLNGPANTAAGFQDFVGIELNSSDGISSLANMEFVYTNTSGGSSVIGSYNGNGWALGATSITNLSISGAVLTDLHLDGTLYGTGGVLTIGDAVQLNNNLTVTGSLSVGGSTDTGGPTNNSTSTDGLTSGVINGTSGAASAGTAHTHGAGSYAVANGQHSHTLNSHAHPL